MKGRLDGQARLQARPDPLNTCHPLQTLIGACAKDTKALRAREPVQGSGGQGLVIYVIAYSVLTKLALRAQIVEQARP